MGALADQLTGDLKEAMRAGDSVRRDEIRGLLAALQAEGQTKLTRELDRKGLILRGGEEGDTLTPEQMAQVQETRRTAVLSDDEEQAVLQTRVKQHRQSIDGFSKGNRADLVAQETAQLAVLEPYLPKQVEGAELDAMVRSAIAEAGAQGPRDMSKVMPLLSQRLRGRADMKQVSARVQALLAGV